MGNGPARTQPVAELGPFVAELARVWPPLTRPSVPDLLPTRTRQSLAPGPTTRQNSQDLPPQASTLSAILAISGYRTGW